jgi:soluble lytic murein transglycosylase-like protein
VPWGSSWAPYLGVRRSGNFSAGRGDWIRARIVLRFPLWGCVYGRNGKEVAVIQIDPILVFTFIDVESSGDPRAFKPDANGGSTGWMQIDMPTARDRGYAGPMAGLRIPITNVTYGVKILTWLTDELTKAGKYSVDNLAAAYNAGLGHVLGGGTDTVYSVKIEAAYEKWKAVFGVT